MNGHVATGVGLIAAAIAYNSTKDLGWPMAWLGIVLLVNEGVRLGIAKERSERAKRSHQA